MTALNGRKTDAVAVKTEAVSVKTDVLHGMLNSELAKFRSDMETAYKIATEQAIAITKATSENAAAVVVSAMELRIARLEAELRARNDQNAITQPRPSAGAESAATAIIAATAATAAALIASDATAAKGVVATDAATAKSTLLDLASRTAADGLSVRADNVTIDADAVTVADNRIATGRQHD
jgi:hypothetical protein